MKTWTDDNPKAGLLMRKREAILVAARRQFLAQVVGVLFGTLSVVPAWYLMAPDKETLEARFAMPAANMWRAVAELLTKGSNALNELPTFAKEAIVVGALIGVLLPLLAKLLPKSEKALPSAMGLGLGVTEQNASGKAAVEIRALWRWIDRQMKEAPHG